MERGFGPQPKVAHYEVLVDPGSDTVPTGAKEES